MKMATAVRRFFHENDDGCSPEAVEQVFPAKWRRLFAGDLEPIERRSGASIWGKNGRFPGFPRP
jgi:hypothetical protein